MWTHRLRAVLIARLTRVLLALALGLAMSATAQAQAATASLDDPVGDAATDATNVGVTWDGTTLTLAATFATPPPTSSTLDVLASESVSLRDDQRCAADAEQTLRIKATGDTARLTSGDLDDALVASAVRSGNVVTFAFASAELTDLLAAEDPFACLSGSAGGDLFFGAFDGKLLRITSGAVADALSAALSERFGSSFDDVRRPWLKCPRQQIQAETRQDYASAFCRFEFRSGGRFHGGGVAFILVSGVLGPRWQGVSSYTKRLRGCRLAATKEGLPNRLRLTGRTLRASGTFGRACAWLAGSAGPAGDLHDEVVRRYPRSMPRRYVVRVHGTGAGDFPEIFRFECRVGKHGSRYTFACRTERGDRFVYAFDVAQKPKPKPPAPPPSGGGCDPNYAGACLDPNASDYDCAGGSGNGPSYVQGPITVVGDDHYGLDSDGDGVACES